MHNVFGISTVRCSKFNEKLSSFFVRAYVCVIKHLSIFGPWEMLFLALLFKEAGCAGYGVCCFDHGVGYDICCFGYGIVFNHSAAIINDILSYKRSGKVCNPSF